MPFVHICSYLFPSLACRNCFLMLAECWETLRSFEALEILRSLGSDGERLPQPFALAFGMAMHGVSICCVRATRVPSILLNGSFLRRSSGVRYQTCYVRWLTASECSQFNSIRLESVGVGTFSIFWSSFDHILATLSEISESCGTFYLRHEAEQVEQAIGKNMRPANQTNRWDWFHSRKMKWNEHWDLMVDIINSHGGAWEMCDFT